MFDFFKNKKRKVSFYGEKPYKPHKNDAGWDLTNQSEGVVDGHHGALLSTGFRMDIPAGFCGLVLPRSSISVQNILVSTGVIDSGYKGEVRVNVFNLNPSPFMFERGQRIAQLVIVPILQCSMKETWSLNAFLEVVTDRSEGGFGSSGK